MPAKPIIGTFLVILILAGGGFLLSSSTEKPTDLGANSPGSNTDGTGEPPEGVTSGGCVRAGCSKQLCIDEKDLNKAVTTCDYNPRYACLKYAPCERKSSGQCGFTVTKEVQSCVAKLSTNSTPNQNPNSAPVATTTPTSTPIYNPSPTPSPTGLFSATPLLDFKTGQLYLNKFPGLLYENSNNPPIQHDADGKAAAAKVLPVNGKIVVISMGMSNWTNYMCNGSWPNCSGGSFMNTAKLDSRIDHTNLTLVDCAQGGKATFTWLDDKYQNYTICHQRLASAGLSKNDVQAVLWMDANPNPTASLTATTICTATSSVEACAYEYQLGQVIRYAKQNFPNIKQFFVHTREYAGYSTTKLNPEPYAYEYGFATKWLVQAQIDQIKTGKVDSVAGDLSYNVAPWIAWGVYFWASGTTPNSDGLTAVKADFVETDGTHPSFLGVKKISDLMIKWYLSSPYTPWFRAQ